MKRVLARALLGLALLFLLIQAVPYGWSRANPPVRREPAWNSPGTRALARRACFDCHSNETRWPWYARIAPASWLAVWDVKEGRRELNFSEFDRRQKEAHESAKEVRKSKMPPWYYTAFQPQARLSGEETQKLIAGLEATFGTSRPKRRRD